jgi:phage tail-like protein
MGIYGISVYGASTYGANARLGYSVEPIELTTINFGEVYVYWNLPAGTYSRARLVRNQTAYPEHQEDGVIIWDEYSSSAMTRTTFRDGEDNPDTFGIVSGKPIYYTMFIFTGDNVWVNAGSVGGVVPGSHDLQKKFMDMLPRVYTSAEQSPLGEVDSTSALYQWIDGFTFTLEDILTHVDLLSPDHSKIMTPAALLPLEQTHVGLQLEPGIPVKNQKQLIREAVFMYNYKGTMNGLSTYIESLTGYAPTVTVSSNILLSPQDSTFYKSTGNWVATGATISSTTEQTPPTVTTAIDENYTLKIVAAGAGTIKLGLDFPITKGAPITPGTTYVLSAQVKSPSSAGSITPSLSYYDRFGTIIGTASNGSVVSANNTWKSASVTKRATNHNTAVVSSATGASGTITYTTTKPHEFVTGTTVTITGFSVAGFNAASATATVLTPTTFSISGSQTGTTAAGQTATVSNNETDAFYAGITLAFSAAGTYYVDMVNLQTGTTPSYEEARAINIDIAPNKTNLIVNPSFETNVTDGWTVTSATVTQDSDVDPQTYSSSKSAKIIGSGNWSYTSAPITITTGGKYYTFSSDIKSDVTVIMTITVGTDSISYEVPPSLNWARYSASILIPLTSSTSTATVSFSGNSGTTRVDCVQFEDAFKATDYFDGSLPSQFGTVWAGTPHNSYSYLYYSKPIKVFRLGQTLNDWVPKGAFWTLSSYAGLEYTNLSV